MAPSSWIHVYQIFLDLSIFLWKNFEVSKRSPGGWAGAMGSTTLRGRKTTPRRRRNASSGKKLVVRTPTEDIPYSTGYVAPDPRALRRVQSPIEKKFRPYYERALNRDLQALVEFYKESWAEADLGSAFYECIGFLTASGLPEHQRIAKKIMKLGDPLNQMPAKKALYELWNSRLLPVAQKAKGWIQEASGDAQNREELWRQYVLEDLPELDCQKQNQRRKEVTQLLEESTSASQARRPLQAANEYLSWGKVPKELFFELASTRPNVAPSSAVRRYVCKLVGISESTVSRKILRKKVG